MKRKIIKTKLGKITRLTNGKFQIDELDSRGKRHRPKFATQDEASAALKEIAAKKSSGGEFLAGAHNNIFDKALDLLIEHNERRGLTKAARDRVLSVINAHLRPLFGARKLDEFQKQRMSFVQDWLDQEAKQHGKATNTLAHIKSAFTLAFDLAIRNHLMGAPNPSREWLIVPRNPKEEQKPLTVEDISALVRAALTKAAEDKDELTWAARGMLVLIGLLAGLRPGECTGLSWDYIHFDDRTIHIQRTWRKGEGIIVGTKTGKSGFRSIPMSPILCAALLSYRERLESMGRKIEGPVLVTSREALFYPLSISGDHWPALATKARFMDANGGLKYVFYNLRHTAANLWRTIGIPLDRVQRLMGHKKVDTTVNSYYHETPSYTPLRRDVEALMRREPETFEHTPEGYIDALGIVLALRWKAEGIDIGCAPPRSVTPQLGHDGQRALPGPTLDLTATSMATATPAPSAPSIKSVEQLRLWQIEQAKQLHKQGWGKWRIAGELGVGFTTVQHWLRHADIPVKRGRLPHAERQELMERIRQMRDEQPEASTTEIAKALGVHAKRITLWERRRGHAMPHRPGAHKIGRFEKQIRQWVGDGWTCRQMAEELKLTYPNAKTPSHSGIGYYVQKLGLKLQRRGGGLRVENYDAQIRELVAAGKSKEEIARELGSTSGLSRSGIIGYINRLELRTVSGDRGKRVVRAENTI